MTNENDSTRLDAVEAWRRREVQAIGAAISNRNWHDLEQSYNALRDKMDRALTAARLAATTTPDAQRTGASEISRKGVENYYRCGYREARYSLDPSVAHKDSTPEEEAAVRIFMAGYDALPNRPAAAEASRPAEPALSEARAEQFAEIANIPGLAEAIRQLQFNADFQRGYGNDSFFVRRDDADVILLAFARAAVQPQVPEGYVLVQRETLEPFRRWAHWAVKPHLAACSGRKLREVPGMLRDADDNWALSQNLSPDEPRLRLKHFRAILTALAAAATPGDTQ